MRQPVFGRGVALAIGVTVAVSTTLHAQSTVYLVMSGRAGGPANCEGRLLTLDLDTPRVVASVPIARSCEVRPDAPYATPDGRYLVWSASDAMSLARQLTVFDTATGRGQVNAIPLPRSPILGNPTRPDLLVGDDQGPFAWSAAGERRFACATCSGLTSVESVSADGTRVAFRSGRVHVFDTATGAPVRALTLPGDVALSRDGATLFHVSGTTLERYDVLSGILLGAATLSFAPFDLVVDPSTGEIFALGDRDLQVLDSSALQVGRTVIAPWLKQYRNSSGFSWMFDPARPLAYATSSYTVEPGTPHNEYFVIDTATLGLTVTVDETLAQFNIPGRFIVATPPVPPQNLTAAVQGSSVQLTWTTGGPPAAVTRFLLEAGSGPGLTDIIGGLDVGLQAAFSASGVPPGRYYVRVRAANYTGLSAPSNEVVVQVP